MRRHDRSHHDDNVESDEQLVVHVIFSAIVSLVEWCSGEVSAKVERVGCRPTYLARELRCNTRSEVRLDMMADDVVSVMSVVVYTNDDGPQYFACYDERHHR